MLRVCQKMGWSITYWNTLPDTEKVDWLAYDIYRGRYVARLQKVFRDMIDDGKIIDVAAYIDTLLAGL